MKIVTSPLIQVFMKILLVASIWTVTAIDGIAMGRRTTASRRHRAMMLKMSKVTSSILTSTPTRIFPRRCTLCYGGGDFNTNVTLVDSIITCAQYAESIPFWLDPNSKVCFEYQFNGFLECGCSKLPRLPSSTEQPQSCSFCNSELQVVANPTNVIVHRLQNNTNMTCEELSLSTTMDHVYHNESNLTNTTTMNPTDASSSSSTVECNKVVNLTLAKEVCGCKARECITCPDGTPLPRPELELPNSLGTCCTMAGEKEEYALYCGCRLTLDYDRYMEDNDGIHSDTTNTTTHSTNSAPTSHPCLSICPDGQLFDPTKANKTAVPYTIINSQTCAELAFERVTRSMKQQLQSQSPRNINDDDHATFSSEADCSFFWYWGVKNCGCQPVGTPCDLCENSMDQPIPDAHQLTFNKTTRYCDTLAGEFYHIFEANSRQCLHAQGSYGTYCGCNNTQTSNQVCRVCDSHNNGAGENSNNTSSLSSLLPNPEGLYTLGEGMSAPCSELEYFADLPLENGGIQGVDCTFVRELGREECCIQHPHVTAIHPPPSTMAVSTPPPPTAAFPTSAAPTSLPPTTTSVSSSSRRSTLVATSTVGITFFLGGMTIVLSAWGCR